MLVGFRLPAEKKARLDERLRSQGLSQQEFFTRMVDEYLGEEPPAQKVVKGAKAQVMIDRGEMVRANYLVVEGVLWVVGRTLNWSQKTLTRVVTIPECLTQTQLMSWFRSGTRVGYIIDALNTIHDLLSQDWFITKEPRAQYDVMQAALREGLSAEALAQEFNPPAPEATAPEATAPVEEPPLAVGQKVKASRLMSLYTVANSVWQRMSATWKVQGYNAPDGSRWVYQPSSNYWVMV